MYKQKKAQFFLIATLIIITLVFSYSLVYVSTNSPESYFDKTTRLAKDIKFEAIQTINNGFYNNLSYSNITQNLLNLTYQYSKSYPEYNLTIIHDTGASQFKDGSYVDVSNTLIVNPATLTLSLNNADHSFNRERGYNFHIIAQKESENEKYIASE